MRNIEKFTQEGKQIIGRNYRRDLNAAEMKEISERAKGDIFAAITYAYYTGIASGYRQGLQDGNK